MSVTSAEPFPSLLRVPPFPGARVLALADTRTAPIQSSDADLDRALDAIAAARVGGCYWSAQPTLPQAPYALIRVRDSVAREAVIAGLPSNRRALCWLDDTAIASPVADRHAITRGACDPWHLLGGADEVFVDADDELALIAAIAGRPLRPIGPGRFATAGLDRSHLRRSLGKDTPGYRDPFTGEPLALLDAVDLCAQWRILVDRNRGVRALLGFAAWKRVTVEPLLWSGDSPASGQRAAPLSAGDCAFVWRSRVAPAKVSRLERDRVDLIEVEDGFIRSVGLGADCIPPLSIIVDQAGIYFDPARPSDLESLLETGGFSPELIDRARRLRQIIFERGIGKYASGRATLPRRQANKRYILVPGQVEDDRSVRCGGGAVQTNLELLRRVRLDAPDAHIIYKPHPDVTAGHRTGRVAPAAAAAHANEICVDQAISSLIDLVDEVQVNTSLAGFEALLRGKPVTTHGVPFYAGWGLTRDLGKVPARRTASRSLDELVAAALLLYPRYLDPVTGLPCPPEILIRRLAEGEVVQAMAPLVRLRRLQGALRRSLGRLIPW